MESQWEFGDLFEQKESEKVYSVSELTGAIKRSLESGFGKVRVSGEVSNFRAQASGHCYFSLKDSGAQLSCVLFRGTRVSHRSEVDNGAKLTLEGDLTVYEARGQYQLIVRSIELEGVGALQIAFEKLKRKLEGEGLFDAARKRNIPRFCFRVGLVTSASGAALQDILHVVQRRNPAMDLVLVPVRVQGQGAAAEIAAGIRRLNDYNDQLPTAQKLQTILATRGGGSIEDLWAFNEEIVARAVVDSKLPVVSAVGHEIDFTICDFVSDLRAPTPSAAAELLSEGVFATREWIDQAGREMNEAWQRRWSHVQAILRQIGRRIDAQRPDRVVNLRLQRLDDLAGLLRAATERTYRAEQSKLKQLEQRLLRYEPRALVQSAKENLERHSDRLQQIPTRCLAENQKKEVHLAKMLELLSPLNVLERGYSITRDPATGKVVTSVDGIEPGSRLSTLVREGEIESDVVSARLDHSNPGE